MADDDTTHRKALDLNLDPEKYGVVAEIGAGQEVARWFFRVGATAGTIAKTVSAYDMSVSDEIYGRSSRYVAADRLDDMLEVEYDRIVARLAPERGARTTFFAFADTFAARNYHGTNVPHGWMGIRFQTAAGSEPSTIRLHACLLDDTNEQQQQAVGVLGVNLIHAAFFHGGSADELLPRLFDALSLARVEVDHVDVTGPAAAHFPPDLGAALVRGGLARAVVWSPDSDTRDPMSVLYGRPVVVERGTFERPEPIHEALLQSTLDLLAAESDETRREPVGVFELSLARLDQNQAATQAEHDDRLEALRALGRPVLLTSLGEAFEVTSYLKRFARGQPIRFAIGLSGVARVFHEAYYTALDGGVLASFARLLDADVRFYVHPTDVERVRAVLSGLEGGSTMWELPSAGLATLENTEPRTRLRHLYRYMCETGTLVTVGRSED